MELKTRNLAPILATLLTLLFAAGCTSLDKKMEIKIAFKEANEYYTKGKFDASEKRYQKVLDEAPDSPYRIHALLGVADSYYMEKEYELASAMYQRFVELYPLDPKTPHAMFYEGMSYFQDMLKVKRDQSNTETAMEAYGRFIKRYAEHPATPYAIEKTAFLNDRLAEKIFITAEFFYQTDAFIACIGRVDELLEKYPETRFKPKALLLKGKAYLAEEAFAKSVKVFLQITKEFPDTPEGRKALLELQQYQPR